MPKSWFPLESNPTVMTTYMGKLGLNVERYSFQDVFSTEDWALAKIPRPVIGVLLLFPITQVEEDYRESEAQRIASEGQEVSKNVYYMKQTIGNACGTVGLLHSVGNGRLLAPDLIIPSSHLESLLEVTSQLEPDKIAEHLEVDDTLEEVHGDAAVQGQTQITNDDVDTHFICFSQVDGSLYELDGRKSSPINHGPSQPETFLEDACKAIQRFMQRQPEENRFTIIALCGNPGEEEG